MNNILVYPYRLFDLEKEKIGSIIETTINFNMYYLGQNMPKLIQEIEELAGKKISKKVIQSAVEEVEQFTDDIHHSFRGTFRSLVETHQEQHKASYEVKEAILDHQVGSKVERAYTHKSNYVEQMKVLLEWYSVYLEELKNAK